MKKPFDALPQEMEQLVSMCKRGDLFGVQRCVALGMPLSPPPGRYRNTPFRSAMKTGFLSLIEVFLQTGVDEEERVKGLRESVYSGREDIFELFIKYETNPRDVSLEDVLASRHKPLIQRYVQIGVDWDDGNQIAHALERAQREFLGIYMDLRDTVPSAPRQAAMALRKHCGNGRIRWVALLLWAGVDPRMRVPDLSYPEDDDFLGTALEEAVTSGHANVVRKIGLDPTKDNPTELLAHCWLANDPDTVGLLLDAGADPNGVTKYGTPMGQLMGGLSWALDGLIGSESRKESALRCVEVAASRGGRWRPGEIDPPSRLRRSIWKLLPSEAVSVLRRLYDCGAIEPEYFKKLMSTPKMRAILAGDAPGVTQLRKAVNFRLVKTKLSK